MDTRVMRVAGPCVLQIADRWTLHGLSGTRVRISGLRGVPQEQAAATVEQMNTLLCGQRVQIKDQWFVEGRTLYARVEFDGRPLAEQWPERRIMVLEPSRRLRLGDQVELVRVSGGLPTYWHNPLPEAEEADTAPFFGEVDYPAKPWLPGYDAAKARAFFLYAHERCDDDEHERKFREYWEIPSRTTLVIFGECGVGKSWFALHNVVEHRSSDSDYAYIDLRGRTSGADLAVALQRELGQYLDHHINQGSDPLKALAHHLYPLVRPMFPGKIPPVDSPEAREAMAGQYKRLIESLSLSDYNDIRLASYDNLGRMLYIIVDNVDNYPEDEQLTVFDFVQRALRGHPGVRIVVPLRPTSKLMTARLTQVCDSLNLGIDLRSPRMNVLLARRCARTRTGREIAPDARLPCTDMTWAELIRGFMESQAAVLLRDLCSTEADLAEGDTSAFSKRYDCRHLIRLFRRLIRSDVLGSLHQHVQGVLCDPRADAQAQRAVPAAVSVHHQPV